MAEGSNSSSREPERIPVSGVAGNRIVLWSLAFVFGIGLAIPLILRTAGTPSGEPGFFQKVGFRVDEARFGSDGEPTHVSLLDRIQALEQEIDAQPPHKKSREQGLEFQRSLLNEGNLKVLITGNGELLYRPGVDALIGANQREITHRTEAIARFASQLQERGIRLTLVPIPDKAVFSVATTAIHPLRSQILEDLSAEGVSVIDLLPLFESRKREGLDLFLRQDTHWTPETMAASAEVIAQSLDGIHSDNFEIENLNRAHYGDLVGMLGETARAKYPKEKAVLQRVTNRETGQWIESTDPDSETVLIGDSFVNVFEDWSLGFGIPGEERIAAGLGAHLGSRLGRALDVIAVNGDGILAPRRILASRPDNKIREKKDVIWLFAERELFLPDNEQDNRWDKVTFSIEVEPQTLTDTQEAETGGLTFTGLLEEKSRINDPNQTPYHSALYTASFTNLEWQSGSRDGKNLVIFLWAFEDRKMKPEAALEVGKKYRISLVPLESKTALRSLNQMDDFFAPEQLFAEAVEAVE